ncbi:MAG TPA: hypothetical protein VHV52_02715 [Gaiellaceae bacterium]|jgi:hypothetical protein|nr:hypothetical protein [Gaiellaceae bacterium]
MRALAAIASFAVAGLLLALAIDAGRWQHVGPRPPATLVGGVAEHILGTADDVALHRAVNTFVSAERTPYGFDNGLRQSQVRARAEAQLAGVATTAPPREASQADDLLGVLAWGATSAPPGVLAPADQAVAGFTDAARLDPANTEATFNLELALRALQGHGVRVGSNESRASQGTGRGGASAGTPGRGY